jgi:hypothetical protein
VALTQDHLRGLVVRSAADGVRFAVSHLRGAFTTRGINKKSWTLPYILVPGGVGI